MKKALALLAIATLISSGCAAVFNDKVSPVFVQSSQPGASVVVDGNPAGATPMNLMLDANRAHIIQVTNASGQQFVCQIGSGIGAVWIVLDIVFGLLPLVVDAATGAWHEIDNGCFAPV